jgi:hypothetical protein
MSAVGYWTVEMAGASSSSGSVARRGHSAIRGSSAKDPSSIQTLGSRRAQPPSRGHSATSSPHIVTRRFRTLRIRASSPPPETGSADQDSRAAASLSRKSAERPGSSFPQTRLRGSLGPFGSKLFTRLRPHHRIVTSGLLGIGALQG